MGGFKKMDYAELKKYLLNYSPRYKIYDGLDEVMEWHISSYD
jgi:hypothetical protein